MYRCECGREFKTQQIYDMHKPYCKGPLYCQNPECKKLLTGYDQTKFCSSSCCAKVTVKGRTVSIETRVKISKSLGGKSKITPDGKVIFLKKEKPCLQCGKPTTNKKYCCRECDTLAKIPHDYEKKNYRLRKEILWIEQNKKCNKCDFNLFDQNDGPYEIHHIDGDNKNKLRENEELLCCNCHFMTDNYRFKGRNHTKESKKLISKNWKNQYTA